MEDLVGLGVFGNETSRCRRSVKELLTQAWALLVVPIACFREVSLGGWPHDYELHREERIRWIASSQDAPAGPSRSRSSSRRSSSSRCESVRGIVLADAPRLSQSLSIRSRRSSVVSRLRSMAGSDMNPVSHVSRIQPICAQMANVIAFSGGREAAGRCKAWLASLFRMPEEFQELFLGLCQ